MNFQSCEKHLNLLAVLKSAKIQIEPKLAKEK